MRKFAVEALNSGFFGANSSCVITMIYALMHMLGPSKQNQEWSQTTNFAMFLDRNNEKRNHLQDAKSSRFGKNPEFLTLVCYHFRSIQQFMETMYETNKMFVSCQRYINCPYMREISFGVAFLYYHILRPFLVAAGTESVEGFKQLTHLELCEFYPAVIAELKNISTSDSSQVLHPDALGYLEAYPKLIEVSHKGHQAIFVSLFEEISDPETAIAISVVRKVVSLLAEGYAGEFTRQTSKHYLEGGIIKQLLDEDPTFMDGVPINALGVEHQVAEARYSIKRAPTANMDSIGCMQIIAKSPYMDLLRSGALSRDSLRELISFARRDPRVKMANLQVVLGKEAVAAHATDQLEKSKGKRLKSIETKRLSVEKCLEHGGPVTSVSKLKQLLKNIKGADAEEKKTKFLRTEIFYQKHVMYEAHCVPDKTVFVCSRRNDLGKMPPKPVSELTSNLKQLLEPVFLESSTMVVPEAPEICKKLSEAWTNLNRSNQVKDLKNQQTGASYDDGAYIATYWQEEDGTNSWYLGRISAVVAPTKCKECVAVGLGALNQSAADPCYEVVYLTKGKGQSADWKFADQTPYHTLSCQVLCTVTVAVRTKTSFVLVSPLPAVIDRLVDHNSICKVLS